MELRAAIEDAVSAVRPLVGVEPLVAALTTLDRPWTVAVVGRVGAGKSSLVNALAGRPTRPVGLGGVTRAVAEVPVGASVLVDTPGIDDPDEASTVLGWALRDADAVVWVVDGLQPLTATERLAVEQALPDDVPLHVVVSRADLLEPPEVGPVLDRVRELTRPLGPATLRLASLRAGHPAELEGLVAPDMPGARRAPAVRAAVAAVRAALDTVPRSPDARERAARFRAVVREVVREVEGAIDRGEVEHETDALSVLAGRAGPALAALAAAIGPAVLPPLPVPEPPHDGALRQILAGFSGIEGARRALRATAARWLVEGEVALLEAADAGQERAAEARRNAVSALDRVEAGVGWAAGRPRGGSTSELP